MSRWEEEVILLDEEMCRTLQFCVWKQGWWIQQQDKCALDETDTLSLGLKVYSEEQAALEGEIAEVWCTKWALIRERARPIVEGNTSEPVNKDDFEGEIQTLELDLHDSDIDDVYDNMHTYSPY